MTFADQAAFKTLIQRVSTLEADLAAALARIAELEAKRGPGRPPKETKVA